MTYVFIFLAALAFLGFFRSAQRRNGFGMAYCIVVFLLWVAAASWWAGRL